MKEILARARTGDQAARDRVVELNLKLVWSIARRFAAWRRDPQDLFQVGCIGLLKAVDRFDLDREVQFSTYAVPLIIGEIRRHLRDDGPVQVARGVRQLGLAARRKQVELAGSLGREPTVREVAEALGAGAEQVVEAVDSLRPPASIYETVPSGGTDQLYLLDRLVGEESGEGESVEKLALRQALKELPQREREILWRRFYRNQTQAQVAADLGVSQVQISRLERRALQRLRVVLGG